MSRWGEWLGGHDGERDGLRAEDARVRAFAATLLDQAHAAVSAAESGWRRERIGPPTRQQPFPDADAVAGAQALERAARAVAALSARLAQAPVPGGLDADALRRLVVDDQALVDAADGVRVLIAPLAPAALIEAIPAVEAALAVIADGLAARALRLA